jgi:hypothetical protein
LLCVALPCGPGLQPQLVRRRHKLGSLAFLPRSCRAAPRIMKWWVQDDACVIVNDAPARTDVKGKHKGNPQWSDLLQCNVHTHTVE